MKKILTLILVFMLVCTLCCCKDNEADNPKEKDNSANQDDIEQGGEDDEKIGEDDIIVKQPNEVFYNAVLYFPDSDALYLHPEQRQIAYMSDEALEMVVLKELFKGPVAEGLAPALEGDGLIISAYTDDEGICTVDFKSDFALLNSGGTARESFAIGAIVNSLCELEKVESVKINIEGNENAVFGGHFTLDVPFEAQTDLIKK